MRLDRHLVLARRLSALVAAGAVTLSSAYAADEPVPAGIDTDAPRLVLQITVDQLRGDLPRRFASGMGEGGLAWILENGIDFVDAHHAHANTETIVGHATLATGAYPSAHGMIGNVWFDRREDRLVYNIEDPRYEILLPGADVDAATEIDPTQKKAAVSGRSPANILVSTLSDEIAIATDSRAKVFGVSVKDRGAVSLAGHTGKAFWFSKAAGAFVSSSYYYDAMPEWVEAWNARDLPARYAEDSWELSAPRESYLHGGRDDLPWEIDLPGYGRAFPHPYGPRDGKYFTTLLTLSPAGDELTLEFAKALIDAESLGEDAITDYLAVSFSSTDYVGHFFGPSSLEAEDNLRRLDRTIASLLAHVDERIGLDETLIVLAADHGGPEAQGYLREKGIEALEVDPSRWPVEEAIAALGERFGIEEGLVEEYFHPYLYLDRVAIASRGLDLGTVQRAVAAELTSLEGVAYAFASEAIESGALPETRLTRLVVNNHNVRRSGDVFVVFEPHAFMNDMEGLRVASTHGSPWSYDTYVPLVFAGAGLAPAKVARRVETVDLAPTVATLLGAKPPSGATGVPLVEMIDAWQERKAPAAPGKGDER